MRWPPRRSWRCWPGDLALVESIDLQLGVYREDMQRDFAFRLGRGRQHPARDERARHGVPGRHAALWSRGRPVPTAGPQAGVRTDRGGRRAGADRPRDAGPHRLDGRPGPAGLAHGHRAGRTGDGWARPARPSGWRARSSTTGGRCSARLGQTARGVLQRHDHQREATQLAASVREAITQATLLEAGAVGLGAVSMAILGSAAADVTGLFAASVLAGVGLWLLPRKRRQAEGPVPSAAPKSARAAGDGPARRVPARARTQRPAHPRRARPVQPLRPRRSGPHPALRPRSPGIPRASRPAPGRGIT